MYQKYVLFVRKGCHIRASTSSPKEFLVATSRIQTNAPSGIAEPIDTAGREIVLLVAALVALLAAVFGPSVAQHDHYHAFADQRVLFGLPCAMDVLSNLPFAIAGLLGLVMVARLPALPQRGYAALFFVGLIVTTLGSIIYHLNPNNDGLALDRLGMVAGFAGMLGLAAAQRVSQRAGMVTTLTVLLLGPTAVAVWAQTDNLLPWVLLQGGAMLMLLVLAVCKPLPAPSHWYVVNLLPVIGFYAAAKLFELADHQIFELTNQVISGHSLKHIVAALAAWPVLTAIARTQGQHPRGHNVTQSQSPAARNTPPSVHQA